MKKLILSLSITTLFVGSLTAQDAISIKGEEIFESKGCAICHKKGMDTIGPSLQTIATVYIGKETSLLSYLRGQGTPIVDPARAPVMNPQLVKIRTLFDEDMQALATYIVSANDRPF